MRPDAFFEAVESRQMQGSIGDFTGYSYRDCTPDEVESALRQVYVGLDRRTRHYLLKVRGAGKCIDCGTYIDLGNKRCQDCHNAVWTRMGREANERLADRRPV